MRVVFPSFVRRISKRYPTLTSSRTPRLTSKTLSFLSTERTSPAMWISGPAISFGLGPATGGAVPVFVSTGIGGGLPGSLFRSWRSWNISRASRTSSRSLASRRSFSRSISAALFPSSILSSAICFFISVIVSPPSCSAGAGTSGRGSRDRRRLQASWVISSLHRSGSDDSATRSYRNHEYRRVPEADQCEKSLAWGRTREA